MRDLLVIAGATLTTDVNGCTQEIAAKIVGAGGAGRKKSGPLALGKPS